MKFYIWITWLAHMDSLLKSKDLLSLADWKQSTLATMEKKSQNNVLYIFFQILTLLISNPCSFTLFFIKIFLVNC